jgi:hypothetical protein
MASIGDYLDRMVIAVTSPDGNIRARVSNYTEVEVELDPRAFERYDEERLGHQLARLGGTTWVAYHRGRSEAYKRSLELSAAELAEAEKPSEDPRRRAYEEELNNIEGEGVSTGRMVRIRTRGMTQWSVDIAPGTIRRLGRERFLAELQSAIKALLSDREMKIIVLKSQYFDLGIPRKWLDVMAELQAINRRRR